MAHLLTRSSSLGASAKDVQRAESSGVGYGVVLWPKESTSTNHSEHQTQKTASEDQFRSGRKPKYLPMTLATTPDQSPVFDDSMSLDDCKRQVRGERRLARQKAIEERLHDQLQQVDDLLFKKIGDLDLAYQWINDRPAFEPITTVYDSSNRGPVNIKPGDRTRKFFMPEGHWQLLEDAVMERLEPQLRERLENDRFEEDRQYRIQNTLRKAVNECWLLCVIGQRQALAEKDPSAFLHIREEWCEELMQRIQSLLWHGSDEMRLACVEPYALMCTMLPPSSSKHLHISELNKQAEATKRGVRKEIELEKKLASTNPAD